MKTTTSLLLAALTALTAQADDFAFKLYDQLKTAEGNLFFSPASIEAALAMTQEGAAGETLRQFKNLLPQRSCFPDIGNSVTLESANAIWVDKKRPILGNFQSAVTEKYDAEIRAADFAGQPDVERETVNRWVEEKTRDKIKDLLGPGSVTPDTRMVLVNAIYFKGDWLHAFDKAKTRDEPFHPPSPEGSGATGTLENQQIDVPMMTLKPERFGYLENESFQCLELPYKGEEISMLVFLPREKTDPMDLRTMVSLANEQPLRTTEVEVFLPKFKVESTFSNLKGTLAALGLTDAFDPARADFSGISTQSLYISDVVHKAFVQVDEEGTEAAAATGIPIAATSIPMPPKVFRADHPFLFLIRENKSGNILFMGRVCDPS